jgi:hypothetical protein
MLTTYRGCPFINERRGCHHYLILYGLCVHPSTGNDMTYVSRNSLRFVLVFSDRRAILAEHDNLGQSMTCGDYADRISEFLEIEPTCHSSASHALLWRHYADKWPNSEGFQVPGLV